MKPRYTNSLIWLRMDEEYDNIQFLLKYSPKYYLKLEFQMPELKDGRVMSKTKRVKYTKSLSIKEYNKTEKPRMLRAFRGQKRNIKNINLNDPIIINQFPNVSKYLLSVHTPQSRKNFFGFLHIRILTIEFSNLAKDFGDHHGSTKALKRIKPRFWKHLSKLKNLFHLNLQIYNKFDVVLCEFMSRLNKSMSLLDSLQTLTLFLNNIEVNNSTEFDFQNVFKYVTSLRIHEAPFFTLQRILNYINNYQNLTSLSILKTVRSLAENEDSVNFQFLQYCKNLSRLKTLDMAINFSLPSSLQSFLQFFSIPKSIVSVKLNFCETNWSTIIPSLDTVDLKVDNLFQENPLCSQFYDKWGVLEDIQALSLCFAEVDTTSNPSLYFIIPLLEKLPKLSTLYYANWYSMESGKKKALDLNYFWQKIQNLTPTLKKLYIENFAISLRNIPSDIVTNSDLEELGLCGYVMGDVNTINLLKLFPKKTIQNPTRSLLEIERLVIDNDESFSQLLDDLLHVPKNICISLNVDVRKVSPDVFVGNVCQKVPKLHRKGLVRFNFSNVAELDLEKFNTLQQVLNENNNFQNVGIFDGENENFLTFEQALHRGFGDQFNQSSLRIGAGDDGFDSNFESEFSEMSEEDEEFEDVSIDDKFEDIDEDI